VLATLATSRTETLVADGTSTASALTSGYQLAFIVGAALSAAAIAVALTVLRPAEAPAEGAEVGELGEREAELQAEAA
jgi:hypothetical protein